MSVFETFAGWVEDGINEGANFVAGIPETLYEEIGAEAVQKLVDLANELGDLPVEVGKFAKDPEGYVIAELREQLSAAARGQIGGAVGDIAGALGKDIGGKVLNEVGLRPLVEGVTELSSKIADLVDEVLSWAECANTMKNNAYVFWTVVGILVGARAAGLLTSKADAEWILRAGQLAELAGPVPAIDIIRDMFPCCVRVAFELPLPEPRPAVQVPNVGRPGAHPILGVFAVMQPGRAQDEQIYLARGLQDIGTEISARKPEGWRIAHISSYTLDDQILFDVLLRRTGADQEYSMLLSREQLQQVHQVMLQRGYLCTGLTAARPGRPEQFTAEHRGQVFLTGVFERPANGQVVADSERLDVAVSSSSLYAHVRALQQQGYQPQFLAPYYETFVDTGGRVDLPDGSAYVGQRLTYAVLARKGLVGGVHYDVEWASLPFAQFVGRHGEFRAAGMQLYSVAAIRSPQRDMRVTAVWRKQRTPTRTASIATTHPAAHTVSNATSLTRLAIPGSAPRSLRRQPDPPPPLRVFAQLVRQEMAFHGWPVTDFMPQANVLHAQGWSVTALAGYVA